MPLNDDVNNDARIHAQSADAADRRVRCLIASNGCFRAFLGAALWIGVLYLGLVYGFGEAVDRVWAEIKPGLMIWRLLLAGVLIGYWPEWTQRFSDWAGLLDSERQTLMHCRWRFAGLLVAIEVLLVQDGLDGVIPITL